MAVQNGVHTFIGKLGTTRGFKMKQLQPTFEGLLGGADKDTILTAPEFQRTRENMAEFGGCALAGKRIRDSWGGTSRIIGDVIVTGRLVAKLELILHLDTVSPRGERRVDINAEPLNLIGFEVNRFDPLLSIASMPYSFTTTASTATLGVASFLPTDWLDIPSGATHFALFVNAQIMANYIWNPITSQYEPELATNNGASVYATSTIYPLNATMANFTVVANAGFSAAAATQSMIGSWGIIFYQDIGGTFYRLAEKDAMRIEAINTP